jgi:hypothetical protein
MKAGRKGDPGIKLLFQPAELYFLKRRLTVSTQRRSVLENEASKVGTASPARWSPMTWGVLKADS